MLRLAFLALLAAAPAAAQVAQVAPPAQKSQLVASVQHRLDLLGFSQVDARRLSTHQLAALHMELRGRRLGYGGFARINTRDRVRIILGWD